MARTRARKKRVVPKKCSKDCPDVCDYCRQFNFNGDENGVYLGKGYCVLHEKYVEPHDGCEYFICQHYKDRDKRITISWPRIIWEKWIEAHERTRQKIQKTASKIRHKKVLLYL